MTYKDREEHGEATLSWNCQADNEEEVRDAWAVTCPGDEITGVEQWPFNPEIPSWVPKENAAGNFRGGVRVSSVQPDGRVRFYPEGGGPEYSAPWEEFKERFRQIGEDEANHRTPDPAYFGFDDGPAVLGFSWGQFWNGWACPSIEKDALSEWMKRMDFDERNEHILKWENGKLYHIGEEDEPEDRYEIEPSTLLFEKRLLTVYNVSLGWCWWEDPADPEKLAEMHEDEFENIAKASVPPLMKKWHAGIIKQAREEREKSS